MNLSKITSGVSVFSLASYFAVKYGGQKLTAAQKEYELVHVQVVFRHGARTPVAVPSYLPRFRYDKNTLQNHTPKTHINFKLVPLGTVNVPESPFEKAYKSRGALEGGCLPGQLTSIGAEQMYELGLFLKKRYVDGAFLTPTHASLVDEIYTRSSNIERTIMSARCVLAGLFSGRPGINALDIHVAAADEEILYPNYYNCGYLKHLTGWAWDHSERIPGIKEIENLVRKSQNIASDVNINLVALRDNLSAECAHGLPSIDMAKDLIEKVENGAMEIVHTAFVGAETVRKETLKLAIGPFVDILLHNIEEKCKEKPASEVKMHLYSGHDTTLIPLLSALGIKNSKWPPYASSLVVELFRKNNATGKNPEYFVKVLYNGEEQIFDGCDSSLRSLDQFKKSVENTRISLDDYRQICLQNVD